MKHATSVTINGTTFSIGDKISLYHFGLRTTGVIDDIDTDGECNSQLRVKIPLDRTETAFLTWWVYDWDIISNDTPPKEAPVSFWCKKVVLYRETPVTIKREVYGTGTEPYAEGFDDKGRYYKFRLDELEKLAKPIEGVVKHGRNK